MVLGKKLSLFSPTNLKFKELANTKYICRSVSNLISGLTNLPVYSYTNITV